MAKIDFGGVLEDVVTSEEFPTEKARDILKDETVAVIGYGVQGPSQSMNLKDNGINVIVGQSKEFKTHRVLFERNIPAFENVANLDALPPRGAWVVALPMKIRHGTGSPLRIVALVPN